MALKRLTKLRLKKLKELLPTNHYNGSVSFVIRYDTSYMFLEFDKGNIKKINEKY
jgi:hypothetical protein